MLSGYSAGGGEDHAKLNSSMLFIAGSLVRLQSIVYHVPRDECFSTRRLGGARRRPADGAESGEEHSAGIPAEVLPTA